MYENGSSGNVTFPLSVTYRIFQVWPTNFEISCQLLRSNDWLNDDICPVVLSHFIFSRHQLASLPKYVSWRLVAKTVEEELEALHEMLVEPIQVISLPCIDFADFVAALGCGGEIRMWRADGETLMDATAEVVRRDGQCESDFAQMAACCFNVRARSVFTMDEMDQSLAVIDCELPEKSLLITSARLDLDAVSNFQVTLMSVMIRSL
jgi:hypothetical protein